MIYIDILQLFEKEQTTSRTKQSEINAYFNMAVIENMEKLLTLS